MVHVFKSSGASWFDGGEIRANDGAHEDLLGYSVAVDGLHVVAGAPGVVFCERGVRGFDPATRNLLDLGAVALLRWIHRLPVLADPSHALGRRDLVPHLARAALAAGADGLLLEAHPDPSCARCDGPQALRFDELARIGEEMR